MEECLVWSNTAKKFGGGGGRIVGCTGITTVNKCSFYLNKTLNNDGGALLVGRGSEFKITKCVIGAEMNQAKRVGPNEASSSGSTPATQRLGSGGGIAIKGSNGTMTGTHVDFNKAQLLGGGIYVTKGQQDPNIKAPDLAVNVQGCQFVKNESLNDGGALAFEEVVGRCSVDSNHPVERNGAFDGGGFYFLRCDLSNGKLSVAGNAFKDNTSKEGKDIFCRNCTGADKATLEQNNLSAGAKPDVVVEK